MCLERWQRRESSHAQLQDVLITGSEGSQVQHHPAPAQSSNACRSVLGCPSTLATSPHPGTHPRDSPGGDCGFSHRGVTFQPQLNQLLCKKQG